MCLRQRRGIQWNVLHEFHGHAASFTTATKSGVCGLHRDEGTARGGREGGRHQWRKLGTEPNSSITIEEGVKKRRKKEKKKKSESRELREEM